MIEPLPPLADFLESSSSRMNAGFEHYYLLKDNDHLKGIIHIVDGEETCEAWGPPLQTLFYHGLRLAFGELRLLRLRFWVRQNNRRMIRICELNRVRKTSEHSFFTVGAKLTFLALGIFNVYEMTAGEYQERCDGLQARSLCVRVC